MYELPGSGGDQSAAAAAAAAAPNAPPMQGAGAPALPPMLVDLVDDDDLENMWEEVEAATVSHRVMWGL